MRAFFVWRLAVVGWIVGSILSLPAQTPNLSHPPTTDQLALLDGIQGVGSLKFGASLDSFDQESLKSNTPPDQQSYPAQTYQFLRTDKITWGTLTPSDIELRFYLGHLVTIALFFNQAAGDLISAQNAVMEKYGNTPYGAGGQISYAGQPIIGGPVWRGAKIQMIVSLPNQIPPGVNVDYLSQKQEGAVELFDQGLWRKIEQEQLDIVQKALIQSHDLNKIKSDL